MKNKIFLYLFIFASLIGLYLFISSDKIVTAHIEKIKRLELETVALKDSVQELNIKVMDVQHFSLENNDYALENYEHLNLENPERYIADKLLETNESPGNNPLIPYEGMEGDFKINKINVLNHKWILAEFTDGKHWGEMIIEYRLKDDLGADFTLTDHLLYTSTF
ncbi:hydrolase [Maribacter sp. 2304DJ31-5]|uniref:hydrolase n=1 Tax=Maribacter sp. 2304DJ31-5 TaxID=3386273 RepID=UPI0039BCC7EA